MKLRNKLILSCAALAACATTMVSTTFAWYTSNSTVTASGVSGTTSSSGSNLLLIANQIEAQTKWNTQVEVVQHGETNMVPLQYLADGHKLVPLEGTNEGTGFLYFDLFLKNVSDSDISVNMKINELNNTTEKLPVKPVISKGKDSLVLSNAATSYNTNVLRVLGMEIEEQQYFGDTDDNVTPQETIASNAYDLQSVIGTQDNAYGDSLDNAEKADAKAYYEAVMGKTLTNSSQALATGTGNSTIALTKQVPGTGAHGAGSYLKLTIKVFINGWDNYCFDACQGQTFTMNLQFDVQSPAA